MRLCDHSDFTDLIRAASENLQLREEIVLKDYWVTRVLRAMTDDSALANKVIFKGGTSLSKGFKLLDRFSEDIDLLITGDAFGPVPESEKDRKVVLKNIHASVLARTGLACPADSFKGKEKEFWLFRGSYYAIYRYTLPGKPAAIDSSANDWVKLEPGYRGGPQPHMLMSLNSIAADFLNGAGSAGLAVFSDCAEDISPFDMQLLAPSRTFVEKLLAMHTERDLAEPHTRHYYDVVRLHTHDEVQTALKDGTFSKTLEDAIAVSNKYYSAGLDRALDLRASPVLNLSGELLTRIERKYLGESSYYFRGQPPFATILDGLTAIREDLPRPATRSQPEVV